MLKVISISYFSAAFFTVVFNAFYFFVPVLSSITNLMLVYTITLGVAYKISLSKRIKYSYDISSILLLVADVIFIFSTFVFTPTGMMGIYNPSYNFIFMMFIAFTIFTPNFLYAILHSLSYATLASVFYVWNFSQSSLFVIAPLAISTVVTVPLFYYFTACLVSYYIWYRNTHYSNIKTYVQNNLITSAHQKLITNDQIDIDNWHILTALINIETDLYGGDFITHKVKRDTIELIIGDVLDHGVDSAQIAFALMSIFHSKLERHPEETILNCHEFLRTMGIDEGGMAYISLIELDRKTNRCRIYGNSGVYPILIKLQDHIEIITKNSVYGVNIDIEKIEFIEVYLKKSEMLVVKTDGWNSEYDEKASIIIGYNDDRNISRA